MPYEKPEKNKYVYYLSKFFRNSKKIMIIGNYGVGNIGDETMLIILSTFLHDLGIRDIIVPSRYPNQVEANLQNKVKSISIFKGLYMLFICDTIVLGGGTLFSNSSGFFMRFSLILCMMAEKIRKKIIFVGFGVTSEMPLFTKQLLFYVLSKADVIILRDKLSNHYLKERGIYNAIVLPDLVYYLNRYEVEYTNDGRCHLDLNKRNIGVALSSTVDKKTYNDMIKQLPHLFDELIEKTNYCTHFIFLTFSRSNRRISNSEIKSDLNLNKRIISAMLNSNDTALISYYPPIELYNFIKKLDLMIGMRFHSKIFSIIGGIPLIGIIAHDKDRAISYEVEGTFFEINNILYSSHERERFLDCVCHIIRKLN